MNNKTTSPTPEAVQTTSDEGLDDAACCALPCPFCGTPAPKIGLADYESDGGRHLIKTRFVKCRNKRCGAAVTQARRGWAITAWNTRPNETSPSAGATE